MPPVPPRFDPKDPSDVRRYELDLAPACPPGQSVVALLGADVIGATKPGDVGPTEGLVAGESNVAFVWAAGGVAGTTITATFTARLANGETLQRSALIPVAER